MTLHGRLASKMFASSFVFLETPFDHSEGWTTCPISDTSDIAPLPLEISDQSTRIWNLWQSIKLGTLPLFSRSVFHIFPPVKAVWFLPGRPHSHFRRYVCCRGGCLCSPAASPGRKAAQPFRLSNGKKHPGVPCWRCGWKMGRWALQCNPCRKIADVLNVRQRWQKHASSDRHVAEATLC